MNYVRTSAGGMMAINLKTTPLAIDKKQTSAVKPKRKIKKGATSESK
jgi:hypothetical protein